MDTCLSMRTIILIAAVAVFKTDYAQATPEGVSEDWSIPKIPDDITKLLVETFPTEEDASTLSRILYFLAYALETGVAEPYISALKSVTNSRAAFKHVAERMAEDTKAADKDPKYRQYMQDVWTHFLDDSLRERSSEDQIMELKKLPVHKRSLLFTISQAFFRNPYARAAVKQSAKQMSSIAVINSVVGNSFASAIKSPLVAISLSAVAIENIGKWYTGEITGKRCFTNIVDSGTVLVAGAVGVAAGGNIGAMVGSAVGGPAGAFVGGLLGGVMGGTGASYCADRFVDWLYGSLFGLSRNAALQNAYDFLGVDMLATNSDINWAYRRLARRYHPDKGGRQEDWQKLQICMAVIRAARQKPSAALETK